MELLQGIKAALIIKDQDQLPLPAQMALAQIGGEVLPSLPDQPEIERIASAARKRLVSTWESSMMAGKFEGVPPLARSLNYLDMLTRIPLGRHLLLNRVFDWWHSDLIQLAARPLPENLDDISVGAEGQIDDMGRFLVHQVPSILSMQERFQNARQAVYGLLTQYPDIRRLASVPSGSMLDFIEFTWPDPHSRLSFLAIDKDASALEAAFQRAQNQGIAEQVVYRQGSAMAMGGEGQLDLILSQGLSGYLTDEELMQFVYSASDCLITGGFFVMNQVAPFFEWNLPDKLIGNQVVASHIFGDIVQFTSNQTRSEDQMEVFFEKGGFEKIAVRRDRFGINPLYIARKRYHSNRRQLRQGAGAGLAAIDGPVHSSSFLPLALALR